MAAASVTSPSVVQEQASPLSAIDPSLRRAERTGIVADPRFLSHETPAGHVERPERMRALLEVSAELLRDPRFVAVEARPATRAELLAVHIPEHVDSIEATAGRPVSMLDPDTFTGPASYETARLAAGGCVALVEAVMAGRVRNGLALVRPPGHHAERDRAMGFCLFNNIAIAAAAAQKLGAARVLIVDWDVHHGNGTQEIFEENPTVFFASLHQFPFYPGTGAAYEKGHGAGLGFTLNVPMHAGMGDGEWIAAIREKVLPAARTFAPDFVLISAGFDAEARDPLGGMRVTPAGFATMARELLALAKESCGGRIVAVLEGGYDLDALRESVVAVAEEFAR